MSAGLVLDSVSKCDVDVRRDLYSGIILTGQLCLLLLGLIATCSCIYLLRVFTNVISMPLSEQACFSAFAQQPPDIAVSVSSQLTVQPSPCVRICDMAEHYRQKASLQSLLVYASVLQAAACDAARPAGGTSLFTSLRERLERELGEQAPPNAKVKVTSPANIMERRFSVWLGMTYAS